MTRAQLRRYNSLGKKQANRRKDIVIAEECEGSVTFYLAFPGIYVTYDHAGILIETKAKAEWEQARKNPVKLPPPQLTLQGGLSSPVEIDDDDVPF